MIVVFFECDNCGAEEAITDEYQFEYGLLDLPYDEEIRLPSGWVDRGTEGMFCAYCETLREERERVRNRVNVTYDAVKCSGLDPYAPSQRTESVQTVIEPLTWGGDGVNFRWVEVTSWEDNGSVKYVQARPTRHETVNPYEYHKYERAES